MYMFSIYPQPEWFLEFENRVKGKGKGKGQYSVIVDYAFIRGSASSRVLLCQLNPEGRQGKLHVWR